MKRTRILQTPLESWESWEFTRDRLIAENKADLVRFARDFVGGAWHVLRGLSKRILVEMILESEAVRTWE